MRRCIQLAKNGEASVSPNPMVGAVIVHAGRVIGEGYHVRCGLPHAEVNAIASVREPHLLSESTLYVNLEPCAHYGKTPPCADLVVERRLKRVVIGCRDPFARVNGLGIRKLSEAGVATTVGVLEDECVRLNKKFFTLHTLRRPYVTLKWAQSEDGYIDRLRDTHSPGSPVQLSTLVTQALVHKLRASNDAILVGTRTALLDNPSLTVRLWEGRNPIRLVVDLEGKLPGSLRLFDGQPPTRVYVRRDVSPKYAGNGVTIVPVEPCRVAECIMDDLAGQNVQSLIVEGGAATIEAFVRLGLWDEARVEIVGMKLGEGVKSPCLGAAELKNRVLVDGNIVETFVPASVKK